MRLLSEIDEICRNNRIRYIVGGIPARAVYEDKKLVFPCLDVYIDNKKIAKLKKKLECVSDERVVESVFTNGSEILYYTDRTTTLINSFDMNSCQSKGIHIRILTRETAGFSKELLKKTKYYNWSGYQVCLPENLKEWYDFLFVSDGTKTFPGYPNVRCIVSTTVGYEIIVSAFPDWKQRCEDMAQSKQIVDGTTARIDERSKTIDEVMDRVRKEMNKLEKVQ